MTALQGGPESPFVDPRSPAQRMEDATATVEYTPKVPLFAAAKRLAENSAFQTTVIIVIVLNALVLALETFAAIRVAWQDAWIWLDRAFLTFFVVELVIRMAAVSFNPKRFFRRGWNIFDFLIVAVALIPGLPADSTVLRLARLARVTRLLAVMPDVRILLDGIRRSLQPVSGLAVITIFLLFLYGMVGHAMFAEAVPEQWGDIGSAMLTLFTVLTLEAWPDIFAEVRYVNPWATPYFISFLLVAVFIVMNMVIGVILGTLEEARAADRAKREAELSSEIAAEAAENKERDEAIAHGIDALRAELADLKESLAGRPTPPDLGDGRAPSPAAP